MTNEQKQAITKRIIDESDWRMEVVDIAILSANLQTASYWNLIEALEKIAVSERKGPERYWSAPDDWEALRIIARSALLKLPEFSKEIALTCGNCPAALAENWERGMLCPVKGYNCCAGDECCCDHTDFDRAIKALNEARRRG